MMHDLWIDFSNVWDNMDYAGKAIIYVFACCFGCLLGCILGCLTNLFTLRKLRTEGLKLEKRQKRRQIKNEKKYHKERKESLQEQLRLNNCSMDCINKNVILNYKCEKCILGGGDSNLFDK